MVAFLLPPLEAVHSSFFVNPCVNAPKAVLFFYPKLHINWYQSVIFTDFQ